MKERASADSGFGRLFVATFSFWKSQAGRAVPLFLLLWALPQALFYLVAWLSGRAPEVSPSAQNLGTLAVSGQGALAWNLLWNLLAYPLMGIFMSETSRMLAAQWSDSSYRPFAGLSERLAKVVALSLVFGALAYGFQYLALLISPLLQSGSIFLIIVSVCFLRVAWVGAVTRAALPGSGMAEALREGFRFTGEAILINVVNFTVYVVLDIVVNAFLMAGLSHFLSGASLTAALFATDSLYLFFYLQLAQLCFASRRFGEEPLPAARKGDGE
jgi:hypothetical protein